MVGLPPSNLPSSRKTTKARFPMKKLLTTALLLSAAAIAVPAHAQFAKAEDAVQYRQSAFRVLGHHFGRLGAMANGMMPYNAATAAADGDVIAAVAAARHRVRARLRDRSRHARPARPVERAA
jgi:cytochrome c556